MLLAEFAIAPEEQRTARRRIVHFTASVHEAGAATSKAMVMDFSASGCKLRGPKLGEGDEIWLKISGMNPVRGLIAWARGDEAGCEFWGPIDLPKLDSPRQRRAFGASSVPPKEPRLRKRMPSQLLKRQRGD